MFKNIKTSPSLLFCQDIYWRSPFKENLWSVWKFGLLCTFSILFCPTFKIQKLEWNLLETKSSFNCFNPKVHPRNNQGDRARVNLITTKGAPPEECFWTNSWRKNCYLFILKTDFESLNIFLRLYIHPFSTKKLYTFPHLVISSWWPVICPPSISINSTQPKKSIVGFLKKHRCFTNVFDRELVSDVFLSFRIS